VWGWWTLCALLLSGCDVIWRLDDVGAAGSADASDANLFSCDEDLHDEDGDGYADACDRCPGIVDAQTDTDMDGVGDACDPSNSESNEIALFISFSDGGPSWTSVSGNWVPQADSLVYTSITQASYGSVVYPGTVPAPPYVMEAHITITSIPTAVSTFVISADSPANGDGVKCGPIRRLSPLRDMIRAEGIGGAPAQETMMMPMKPGGFTVKMNYAPKAVGCSLAADDQTSGGSIPVTLTTVPAEGALAFRSLQIGASVQYVVFYKVR
jgi:hypothetical protein